MNFSWCVRPGGGRGPGWEFSYLVAKNVDVVFGFTCFFKEEALDLYADPFADTFTFVGCVGRRVRSFPWIFPLCILL